jgi:hypothetical protein
VHETVPAKPSCQRGCLAYDKHKSLLSSTAMVRYSQASYLDNDLTFAYLADAPVGGLRTFHSIHIYHDPNFIHSKLGQLDYIERLWPHVAMLLISCSFVSPFSFPPALMCTLSLPPQDYIRVHIVSQYHRLSSPRSSFHLLFATPLRPPPHQALRYAVEQLGLSYTYMSVVRLSVSTTIRAQHTEPAPSRLDDALRDQTTGRIHHRRAGTLSCPATSTACSQSEPCLFRKVLETRIAAAAPLLIRQH